MKKTTMRAICAVLCLVMLFLTGCTAAQPATQTQTDGEKHYKDTIILDCIAKNLNSYDFDGGALSQIMTHDRLVEKNLAEDKPLEMIPGLATEWEWIDDTTLEMKLREDAVFHNGEPFTSDDVVFTFNECLMTHSMASKMNMLDHVEAIDDYTVRFVLKYYYCDFMVLLSEAMCSIVNREAIEADEEEGCYIGTGPYIVREFVQSDYETLDRNDNYWGEKGKTPHFRFRSVPEVSTGLMALENGEMDAVAFDVVDMHYVLDNPNLTARINPNAVRYFAFNTSRAPGNDKNLRLAVAYAINIDDILAVTDPGYSTPQATMWGPPKRYGFNDAIEPYGRDLEKAKQYLEKSKYKEFTINCTDSTIAEVIQANCKDIGLKVNIETMDGAAITAMTKFAVAEHDSTIYPFFMAVYGDDCRRLYYPNNNVNKAILTDERIVELIDNASKEKDEEKRLEMYHEIQEINHEEAYYIPLCVTSETMALNANLKGVNFDDRGRHQWTYAYIEE